MKRPTTLLLASIISLPLFLGSCHGADLWDELPTEISSFIDLYYPNSEVNSITPGKKTYSVRLQDGPGFSFRNNGGGSYSWLDLNGYGLPLKEIVIYDQAPEPLYEYLETISEADGVFRMTRDATHYGVLLLSDSLSYEISSSRITTVPVSLH